MSTTARIIFIRMLPVLFITVAAMAYAAHVEGAAAYPLRNAIPMLIVIIIAALTLYRGGGRWSGAGWSWPLGTLGFAIPALGLSLYLHYGYSVDLGGMYSESVYPRELFRYLPAYTMGAGAIGFALGWIVGRNV